MKGIQLDFIVWFVLSMLRAQPFLFCFEEK
jgi:hypothetical protein